MSSEIPNRGGDAPSNGDDKTSSSPASSVNPFGDNSQPSDHVASHIQNGTGYDGRPFSGGVESVSTTTEGATSQQKFTPKHDSFVRGRRIVGVEPAELSLGASAYRKPRLNKRLKRIIRGFLLFLLGLVVMGWIWQYDETGSLFPSDLPPYSDSSVGDISDPNDSAVPYEFSNPAYYEVELEDNDGIWSYDDRRGYGGVTAINPLGTGWPNDIDWSEIEGEREILFCWAPTRDEAVSIALDAVEFGEGFGRDEFRGFGEEAERVEPEPHCELVPVF